VEDSMTEITYQNPNVFDIVESKVDGEEFILPASAVSALEIEIE
jgi:hypothetical protein